MRPLLIGSLFLLASPLCLTVACGSSGDSSGGGTTFGGSGGTSNGGSSSGGTTAGGSSNGGSAGSSNGGTTNGGSSSGGSTNGGNGGSAGSSGNGGNGGAEDAGIPDVNFTYDAPVITEDACAATRIEADPIPLDMYIVLDDSGSMGSQDCNVNQTGSSKWCYAVKALWEFFNASESVGTGVALNYFNNGYSCSSANGLTAPPGGGSVAFDILPNHLSALQSSLNAKGPTGGTPTSAALKSIATYTAAQAPARPGRTMIGVLITDGLPEACTSGGDANLRSIVQNHFTATGIPTFMIGMTGADFARMDTWGQVSGSPQHSNYCGASSPCYSYNVGNGSGTVFIDVLKEIQKAAVGCTFNLPVPDSGILDINKIDVVYTPGGGGAPQTLTRVTDQSQCSTAPGQGWHYDDNINPTQIILCPDVCTAVSADSGAKIDVELGCLGS